MLKIDEIEQLIKMIDQSSIQRFELEQESSRLIIVKNDTSAQTQPARPSAERIAVSVAKELPASPLTPSDVHTIVSPVVGTFYSAPEPGAEPFAKIAQKVTSSTILCIVEVMKLFNEVEAGVDGEIMEILAKDGEFVEYGQPLFRVRVC